MSDVIRTERLSKYYGSRRGLDGLDLEVRAGEVFGFLGPNGAGKTTTIRLLLDLIRPTSGEAQVLGHNPRGAGRALRRRLGYLPGDFVVDGGQSAGELLAYLGNLRGGVARSRIEALAERLELDLKTQIGRMSRGNRQKVGEVQQCADRVGIVRDGRMVAVEAVETLRHRAVRRVEIHFDEPVPGDAFSGLPHVLDVEADGRVLRCHLAGRADPLIKAAARYPVESLVVEEPGLEELFFTYYRAKEGSDAA